MTQGRLLLAVDGNSLVHRSFHAQAHTNLRDQDGRAMWAVRGLLMQLVTAVERVGPDAVVVGFDDAATSIRKQRWPQYKANRTDKLETLVGQLALAADVLRELGVAVVVPTGLEADDVLASASATARAAGGTCVIMTSDRDAFALIDEHTRVLRIINGGVDASPLLTPDRLRSMIGIGPGQYRDYAALRGDPSDNLPGVSGIGPKTAAKLLCELGSARTAFEDLDADGGRVQAAIGAGASRRLRDPAARVAWRLNCQVMHMHADVDLGLTLAADGGSGRLPYDIDAVRAVFGAQRLTATTATALRVLAHQESAAPTPSYAWSRADSRTERDGPAERDSSTGRAAPWRSGSAARRPARKSQRLVAAAEQLSLFDAW